MDRRRWRGEGAVLPRYINLILWILDRWWKESAAAGPSPPPRRSLNIHRKEGIEIGCNRI